MHTMADTPPDHVQVMAGGVRSAGSDLATVADHLDGISYLTASEGAALTAALAHVEQQVARALYLIDSIEGPSE